MHDPETHGFLATLHPMGRMGAVKDIIDAVFYRETADFITGETFYVDGGADQIRAELSAIRRRTSKPINLNFFCHAPAAVDTTSEAAWRQRLRPYYVELGLDPEMPAPVSSIPPFEALHCDLIADLRPEIVSFHFGLPSETLMSSSEGLRL